MNKVLILVYQFVQRDELENAAEAPEVVASRFTCPVFDTPQAVLAGARHMV